MENSIEDLVFATNNSLILYYFNKHSFLPFLLLLKIFAQLGYLLFQIFYLFLHFFRLDRVSLTFRYNLFLSLDLTYIFSYFSSEIHLKVEK